MNEAQKAAIQRCMVIIDNMRAGATKIRNSVNASDSPEKTYERIKAWLDGIDAIGNSGVKWLEAAYNDRDYPSQD